MENFINKLLGYDYSNISYLERLRLCKEVLRLCEGKIPEQTNYDAPKLHLIMNEFDSNANSYSINERIHLDRNAFTSCDNLVESLWDIAHECCHGAQQKSVTYNSTRRDVPNMFVIDPKHYVSLYIKCSSDYEEKLNQVPFRDRFVATRKMNEALDNIENYLKGFYLMCPVEREADDFAINLIEELIQTAEGMELNALQSARLNSLKEDFEKKKKILQKQLDKTVKYRDNAYIRQNVVNSIRKTREEVLNKNVFECCQNTEESALMESLEFDTTNLYTIIRGLELDYDDDFAHKLFNALSNNTKLGEIKNVLLYALVGYTAIDLTPEEDAKFRQMLNVFKGTSLDYDTFMSEKARIREVIDDYMINHSSGNEVKHID